MVKYEDVKDNNLYIFCENSISPIENLKRVSHLKNSKKNLYLNTNSIEMLKDWGFQKLIKYNNLKLEGFINAK